MTATFTTGNMGSGKSKNLIDKFKEDDSMCIAFAATLEADTGTLGTIDSRNGQSIFALNLNYNQPDEVIKLVKGMLEVPNLETVYIDEVQFFDKLTVSRILNFAIENEVNVHFYGLDTTFTGEYFESSNFLLSSIDPDKIDRIPMLCQYDDCNFVAKYNARIVDGKVTRQGETFVSAKSKYLSFCEKHYFQ